MSYKTFLSKTKFVAGLQCHLRMWYQCHGREFATPFDPFTQSLLDAGTHIGELACELFPNGKVVDVPSTEMDRAAEVSKELMSDESVGAIFEATFVHDGVRIRVDVLERCDDGSWNLIEVKSSTKVKKDHLPDTWIQRKVLMDLGLDIASVKLVHVNREYVHDCEKLNLSEFFTVSDLTSECIAADDELAPLVEQSKAIILNATPPDVAPSPHCRGCEFFKHCTADKPEDWIFYLPRINKAKFKALSESGIERIPDVPDSFSLTAQQTIVRDATRDEKLFISSGLHQALDTLVYPLYFLDFETVMPAIPIFVGTSPYDQVVFQWSCHVLQEDGTMEHFEYLHTDASDPRPAVIESMTQMLNDKGSIIHYTGFETLRIKDLINAYPHESVQLTGALERLWDLHPVIRDNYYDPKFQGSYSIKKVLPAVAPELSYADLTIKEGGTASLEFVRMVHPETSDQDRQSIDVALREYCKLDTLAMFEVWRKLREF